MAVSCLLFFDAFFAIIALHLLRRLFFSKHTFPLPPGPPGLPIVGNIFDMPSDKDWLTYAKWGELYG